MVISQSGSALQTRPSLLLRIRNGQDADAWHLFVELYAPLVIRHCRRRGLQDADSTDVTQEVLIEVARTIRKFDYQPERGRFRDWLWTITNRKLAQFFSRQNRNQAGTQAVELLDGHGIMTCEPQWSAEFDAEVLRVALAHARPHFEPTTWRAFELAWLESSSAAAVAIELGIPIETVYVAKSRVLKRLEEEVQILAEDLPHVLPLRLP